MRSFTVSAVAAVAVLVACGTSGDSPAAGTGDGGVAPGGGDAGSADTAAPDVTADVAAPIQNAPAGANCSNDGECASGACDYLGHCAAVPSCARHLGGDTCGAAGDESCCSTIRVPHPTAPYSLDKFNITAGRFRAFVERTKGDVRGWMQAHRPAWFPPAWDAWLPNQLDDGTVLTGPGHLYPPGVGRDGLYQQLGPAHYGAAEAGGNEGCVTSQVGNARTYRLPDDVNTRLFGDTQQYTEADLDPKPQQCTTFFMFAAFCAWDGGRLPTLEELDYAWDAGDAATHTYPWGNTPAPGGWDNAYPFDPTGSGFGAHAPAGADLTRANYRYNFWMPAKMQCLGDDPAKCDYSLYLSPPGHFPAGNGPFGHADLAGNVYDFAMPPTPQAGVDPANLNAGLARTGAFDAHAIPNQRPATGSRTFKATNKYLAVGARCAR